MARDQLGRFAPGESGNRGGRPRLVAHVRELAQQNCEAAVEELVRLMLGSPDDRVRVAAAREVLDRGIGRSERASSEAASASLTEALAVIAARAAAGQGAKVIEGTATP